MKVFANMRIESFFTRFRPKPNIEIAEGQRKTGRILVKASKWAEKQTKRFKLHRQPFALSEHEIEVVHTRLAELRSERLLNKMPLKKAADTAETAIKLRNYFQKKYQTIFQQVVENYEIVNGNATNTIWNYLENCKELAPSFEKGKCDSTQLMEICNRIRAKQPVVLFMKTGTVNN